MFTPTPSPLVPNPYLLQSIRLPFWFACSVAVIGAAWRPPLASVLLITVFLVLLVAVEWVSRRLPAKNLPTTEKTDTAEPIDETIRQQVIRSKTAEGLDRLDGTFWTEFPADAMTATVHVPFCPAFERVPKIQVFPVNETDAQLRITSPKTFGVRVDVKRSSLEIDRLCFAIIAEEEKV
jgi:membrane protein implicated in regulation of membrane protease activity